MSFKMPRRPINLATVFIIFCTLLWGCGKEKVALDLTPPETPQFVARSADTALVEQGIDAVPEGDYIKIVWQAVYDEDMGGYRIYRQREDSILTLPRLIADLPIQELGGQATPTYLDMADSILAPDLNSGLSLGFYYWVSAYDQAGNESALSSPVYYKLIPKAEPNNPAPPGDSLVMTWGYSQSQGFQTAYFVIRLFTGTENGWVPFWMATHELFNQWQVVYPQSLPPGNYLYQVDVVGSSSLPSGSEAAVEFSVN